MYQGIYMYGDGMDSRSWCVRVWGNRRYAKGTGLGVWTMEAVLAIHWHEDGEEHEEGEQRSGNSIPPYRVTVEGTSLG